jgi:hypothetical protein
MEITTSDQRKIRERRAVAWTSRDRVRVELGDPITVSSADPAERTWGYWQFPTLSRIPGGELLLTVNNTQDDDLCYGHAGPAWLSHDDGETWHAADLDEKSLTIAHSPVCAVQHGEFLCCPMPLGYKPSDLPAELFENPVAKSFSYIWRLFFPLEKFPEHVKEYFAGLRALRWTPATRQWNEEKLAWDLDRFLLRLDDGGMIGKAWSRTSLEYRPLRVGDELLDANYKVAYRHDDGSPPTGFEVWCMASTDNGRNWRRRGLIATDPDGAVGPTESSIARTTRGGLVCVCRTTDHRQLPMWVVYSEDNGRTWSEPVTLDDHGVLPTLELLGNGVMVLSYGRPGVQVSFSPDGGGRAWTEPIDILPTGVPPRSDGRAWKWEELLANGPQAQRVQKCGYTSMVPLGVDRLLIAYTDVAHTDARGRLRKAVKVRAVRVNAR